MPGTGLEVCVVEDDADFREEMQTALQRAGFAVRAFCDSLELYAGLLEQPCDLLVLDLGLPGEDGRSVMRRLKAVMKTGVVIVTARGDVDSRVDCMMDGADAYLVKPVDFRELVATLVSVSRRAVATPALPGAPAWQLQDDGWTLAAPTGGVVSLTPSERSVVSALFADAGRVVSREALIVALGHDTDYYLEHRLDMLISRLRRKVREGTGIPLPVRAVRGAGFMLSLS